MLFSFQCTVKSRSNSTVCWPCNKRCPCVKPDAEACGGVRRADRLDYDTGAPSTCVCIRARQAITTVNFSLITIKARNYLTACARCRAYGRRYRSSCSRARATREKNKSANKRRCPSLPRSRSIPGGDLTIRRTATPAANPSVAGIKSPPLRATEIILNLPYLHGHRLRGTASPTSRCRGTGGDRIDCHPGCTSPRARMALSRSSCAG